MGWYRSIFFKDEARDASFTETLLPKVTGKTDLAQRSIAAGNGENYLSGEAPQRF